MNSDLNNKEYINNLPENGKYIFDLILKAHSYFSQKDKFYKKLVRVSKILILLLAMGNTVVLALKDVINMDTQIILGVILSASVTFFTAITTYFNLETYWMRNIQIHIQLNILRDDFLYNASANKIDNAKIEGYKQSLENIQNDNIKYWNKALNKI